MKNKNSKNKNDVMQNEVIQSIINNPASKSDPMGSYTGVPIEENEKPVQDADDL